MTQPTEPAEVPSAPPAAPKVVHSGMYTLWETPDGGRLLAFKRLHTTDEGGRVIDLPEPVDERLPHVPAEALPLLSMWLEQGFPPAILAMIRAGKANPLAMIKQLRDMAGTMPGGDDGAG
jgi:hypothetical protein